MQGRVPGGLLRLDFCSEAIQIPLYYKQLGAHWPASPSAFLAHEPRQILLFQSQQSQRVTKVVAWGSLRGKRQVRCLNRTLRVPMGPPMEALVKAQATAENEGPASPAFPSAERRLTPRKGLDCCSKSHSFSHLLFTNHAVTWGLSCPYYRVKKLNSERFDKLAQSGVQIQRQWSSCYTPSALLSLPALSQMTPLESRDLGCAAHPGQVPTHTSGGESGAQTEGDG